MITRHYAHVVADIVTFTVEAQVGARDVRTCKRVMVYQEIHHPFYLFKVSKMRCQTSVSCSVILYQS